MKTGFRTWSAAMIAILPAALATAATPSFQITALFSNLDGTVQFIQLREVSGMNGQHHFKGLTLTSTHNGVTKQVTFPADLPDDQTAGQNVLISTSPGVPYYGAAAAFGEESFLVPDFVIPPRFIPIDGGTIDFSGSDEVVYPPLPYDGWQGWSRNGSVGAAYFHAFRRDPIVDGASAPVAQDAIYAIEYYNAVLDHYFITASSTEIDALESGRVAGWTPTSNTIPVLGGKLIYVSPNASLFPDAVCRFYIPPGEGDSHFYSASADECEIARVRFPEFIEENSTAFFVRLPDLETGKCPLVPETQPPLRLREVFRLWNKRPDSNHRYTMDPVIRDSMIQKGYVSEGYGPSGVAYCVF